MSERRGAERRKLRRYLAAIDCAFEAAAVVGHGQIVNISQQGVFVRSDRLPESNAQIALEIDPEGAGIRASGTVRWTTDQLPPGAVHPRGFGVLVDPTEEFLTLYEHILLH